jgi:hypothetical protein
VDSNHRPSGYEPDELPLLHAAANAALASVEFSVLCFEFTSHQLNTENSTLTTQLLVRRVVLRSQRTLRQYHRCCTVSRPGSGWFGVGPARSAHASGSGARCNWWNACSSPAPAPGRGRRREALARARCSPLLLAEPSAATASPGHLPGGLPARSCECAHLGGSFPLRCCQRF